MKILIADSFPQTHIDRLDALGHTCTHAPELDQTTLPNAIADHQVLIVRSTRVDPATIDAGARLQLIIRAGAGTNTIDKAHAAKKNVRVCNVPGANAIAVAELAIGLMLSIDRHLADNVADLRQQIWNKKKYSSARGLYGQTLGILGLGAIGIAVAERAAAFGMPVIVTTRPGRSDAMQQRMAQLGITEVADLAALLSRSDIVSLHLPANPDTRGLVNAGFLAQMQPGAMLINTSRGELVDEAALIDAMNHRQIRAGLDVYQNEPGAGDERFDGALARHPGVCGTHHIGASTRQAQVAVADGVLRVIESFQADKLIFCVNNPT